MGNCPRDSITTAFSYLPRIKIKLEYATHIYAFWLQSPSFTVLLDHLVSRIGLPPKQVWYKHPVTEKRILLSSQLDFMQATQDQPSTLKVIVDEL
ncbi:hypothetical protein DSO57_1036168 [Entomophthora muscae]|uniref:Uncharacterized protein n=1 Tax=Entomophthora muscae TaxID=34485 RepID=A0ACC2U8C7_9FUNG|nr:hypothetical protein DSO57_1036168 [Entomophthora muscae]